MNRSHAISQFQHSSDFITIAKRKKGDWLRVDNQGNIRRISTWLGKRVFCIRNYFLGNEEIKKLASALEGICNKLETTIGSIVNFKVPNQNAEDEVHAIVEQAEALDIAQHLIHTMQERLKGIRKDLAPKKPLHSLKLKLIEALTPFAQQLKVHVATRKCEPFNFIVHDSNHNAVHSKQLLLYERMVEQIKIIGSKEHIEPVVKAVASKVDYACRKILDKQKEISAVIDENVPLYEYPKALDKGYRSLLDLRSRLKEVDRRFYDKGVLKKLETAFKEPEITEAYLALEHGHSPKLFAEGISGTYLMPNRNGKACGIFKPAEQEIGASSNPKGYGMENTKGVLGVTPGTCYLRERVAYLLDKDHLANVPYTVIASFAHNIFNSSKSLTGSFQMFAKGCQHLLDTIPKSFIDTIVTNGSLTSYFKSFFVDDSARISVEQIHALAIFDIRVLNCDRHLKNALVDSCLKLYPIDHGLILPTEAKKMKFEWMRLSQSKQPFSNEILKYIESLDEEGDAAILHENKIEKEAIIRMRIAYKLLKIAAKAGMTAYEIGDLMKGRKETSYFETTLCRHIISLREPAEKVLHRAVSDYIKAR